MAKTPKIGQRLCPKCKEIIRLDASICKHCGTEFSPDEVKAAKADSARSSRKAAIGCLGLVFALGCCTYLIGKDEPESSKVDETVATAAAETGGPSVQLTKLQESVVSTMRLAIMRTVDCQWSAKTAQSEIDKAAAGRSRPIDAYEEAKRAEKTCSAGMRELGRPDLLDNLPEKDRQLEKEALVACRDAAAGRRSAMALAMQIIDGDDSMANASAYREKLAKASNDEALCRMNLLGVAEDAGIPDSEVDFAQIKAPVPS